MTSMRPLLKELNDIPYLWINGIVFILLICSSTGRPPYPNRHRPPARMLDYRRNSSLTDEDMKNLKAEAKAFLEVI